MVKKVLVPLLLAAGLLSAVPSLRARTLSHLRPAVGRAYAVARPLIDRVLNPLFRWSTRNEEEQYLLILRNRANLGEPLPRPSEFRAFAARSAISARDGNDRWGSPYYLVLTRDSIRVGSAGPDLERGTDDDVVSSVSRR